MTVPETAVHKTHSPEATKYDVRRSGKLPIMKPVPETAVSGIDLPVAGAPDGPDAQLHYYSTPQEAIELLEDLIRDLVDSQIDIGDIVLLSTRRPVNSLLSGCRRLAGYRLVSPSEDMLLRPGDLLFSTMHTFKGLERQAVVALDMAEIGQDNWSMLHYTGLSRARVLLHVLLPATAKSIYDKQARAFGRRLQPTIV